MSSPRIALYAGSFNPFHIGHHDILNQAEKIFDEVYVGVGHNGNKSNNVTKAIQELGSSLTNRVIEIHGTITATMKSLGIQTLVRGVRNTADLVEEANMGRYLRELYPGINIVYLFPTPGVEHVSSSAIRELININTAESLALANRYLVCNSGATPMVPFPGGYIGGGHSSQAKGVYSSIQPSAPRGNMFDSLTRKLE